MRIEVIVKISFLNGLPGRCPLSHSWKNNIFWIQNDFENAFNRRLESCWSTRLLAREEKQWKMTIQIICFWFHHCRGSIINIKNNAWNRQFEVDWMMKNWANCCLIYWRYNQSKVETLAYHQTSHEKSWRFSEDELYSVRVICSTGSKWNGSTWRNWWVQKHKKMSCNRFKRE